MSLLKKNIVRKERIEEVLKLNVGNKDSKKYKMEAIYNSAVYVNELKSGHLPSFYYLIAWKGCFEEQNT